jgi:AraC-like DNA-binding protein
MDAAPVRAHMLALREAGMSEAAVARRLNISETYFKNLMRGSNGRTPGQRVWREVGEAVLEYWPTLPDFPDTAHIDPTGTLRRVQALETLGWSKPRIAAELGQTDNNFKMRLRSRTVSARMARRVAAVYDRLWTQRPEDHGVQPYVAERVRRHAAQNGFAGPLAWDDDTIDDPKAEPQTDAAEPVATEGGNVAARWLLGESVDLGRDDRREVLQHLFEWTNDTTADIAARLDMTPEAAERQWERLKERAAADGRRLWRRVYVPRERTMKQNEMGEAA